MRKDGNLEKQETLAGRLQAGERAAAVELVDKYYEQIYLYMRRLGHSRDVSEDLTQECFLQVWKHIGQLRSGRALKSWMYHIAGNVSKLYWRKHGGRGDVSLADFDMEASGEDELSAVERNEQLVRLTDTVGRLPLKLRQTIVLHYMQHLTISESSDALGIRKGTFKSRLNRALSFLRKELK
jgi:RNA polymerase sigma-70 factor (ECF subfamily)